MDWLQEINEWHAVSYPAGCRPGVNTEINDYGKCCIDELPV